MDGVLSPLQHSCLLFVNSLVVALTWSKSEVYEKGFRNAVEGGLEYFENGSILAAAVCHTDVTTSSTTKQNTSVCFPWLLESRVKNDVKKLNVKADYLMHEEKAEMY